MMKKMVHAGLAAFFLLGIIYREDVVASPAKKLVVLPFNIYAATDLSYLQDGVYRMITARLEPFNQTIHVEQLEAEEGFPVAKSADFSGALKWGKRTSADFVLWGSITVLGEKISTDIQLIDVKTGKTETSFSRLGQNKEDILGHVDACAEMLIAYFSEEGHFVKQDSATEPIRPMPDTPLTIVKTKAFDLAISGLSSGDVIGNGQNEVVVSEKSSLYIYENILQEPTLIFEYKEKANSRILGVDVADIDHDGQAEIYVTTISENSGSLKSFVLAWQDDTFKKIADREKWFLRVIDTGREKRMLVGQKRGTQSTIFKPGIHEMGWENRRLVTLRQLKVPPRTTVFGFTIGDVFNNGKDAVVSLNREGHVVVYQEDGKEVWVSPGIYGGSENFIEYDTSPVNDDNFHYYLAQRIFVSDIAHNGVNELVLVSNHEMTGRIFARMRHYDSGFIECLAWDRIGFRHILKTQDIAGYISDYHVGDFNQNGQPDLIFSVVSGSGNFLGEKSSYLVFWEYGS